MSASDHYNTPERVLNPLRRYIGGAIDLDPCSNVSSVVNAKTEWDITRGEDGLKQCWKNYRTAFVNPPYSPGNLPRWIEKCYEEFAASSILRVFLLIPVSTSTKWWHRYAYTARWHLYFEGRIQFDDKAIDEETSTNRHDSVLMGWENFSRPISDTNWLQQCLGELGHIIMEPGELIVPG